MKDCSTNPEVRVQLDRMRELYKQIGEPLTEDICDELAQHLGRALELSKEEPKRPRERKLDA